MCRIMDASGTKPELEAYDVGHLYNIAYLLQAGIVKAPITMQFVNRWLDLIETHTDLAHNKAAADLVSARERRIKGGRARLVNQSALDRWSGGSGLGRLDFRWTICRRHLEDLYSARDASCPSLPRPGFS